MPASSPPPSMAPERDAESGQVAVVPVGPSKRAAFQAWAKHEAQIVWDMLRSSWLNLLLVLVPIALGVGFAHTNAVAVFVLNFVALVPLALLLGDVTEHLAERFGDVIGGLLNASFGNIVEIVLAIQALRKDLNMLVEMSLVGSVLSNLLMVLGFVFVAGGYYHHNQTWSADSTTAQFSLIFLAVIGICISTAAPFFDSGMSSSVKQISHGCAVMLFASYLAYLFFQLYTHPEVGEAEDDEDDSSSSGQGAERQQDAAVERAEQQDQATELASRLGGAEKAYQLPSVPSGRALSKMEHLPSPHIADAPHVGRSTSGRSYEPDVRVGGAAADTLRARTRSGTPLDGEKQLSGVGGTSLRMHAHNSTEKGKPIELVRTASGRMVEMVRTDSGRLVELHHPLDRHSYRIGEGKTMSGRHLLPMDRTASGRYTVRTESGRYMTDLELIELNRARRVSGRPALKHVVVVGTNVPEGGDADPLTAAPSSLEVGLSPEGEVTLEEEAILSVPVAILMLAGMAVLIAVHCEFLTEAIQEFGEMTHLSQPFIGLILVPIAGNACEHMAAVVMAAKGRMNLALGIAIGSALQISLMVIPLLVIISWGMGKEFELDIDVYPLFCLIFSVVMAYQIIAAGKSTWLSGIGPCVIYLCIAVAYFYNTAAVDLGK